MKDAKQDAIDEFFDGIWQSIDIETCECEYLNVTEDMYGTGDSPTGYECTAREAKECPKVQEYIKLIKGMAV